MARLILMRRRRCNVLDTRVPNHTWRETRVAIAIHALLFHGSNKETAPLSSDSNSLFLTFVSSYTLGDVARRRRRRRQIRRPIKSSSPNLQSRLPLSLDLLGPATSHWPRLPLHNIWSPSHGRIARLLSRATILLLPARLRRLHVISVVILTTNKVQESSWRAAGTMHCL